MELKLDMLKEYGIVLEGGGAKGAYQIGAWKALREAGIKIRGVSGVSVGALNGALICMDDFEKAEDIWENICYSKVMDVSDELMESVIKRDLKSLNFQDIFSDIKRILKDKGFDVTPLRQLIEETVLEDQIRNSDRDLFVTTYSVSDRQLMNVDVKTVPEGSIADMLLASAYFPVFKNEKLGGKKYLDGGGFNNVPIDVLLEHGYRDILVIRIYGLGYDSERTIELPEDARITHIAPRQDLGGILEFDKKRSKKNMLLGYYDAKRTLYGLCGHIYYIDAPETEGYYLTQMIEELGRLKGYIDSDSKEEGQTGLYGYRAFTEGLFPELAKQLKLREGWDYKELYLSILEDLARRLRIKRFQVYTAGELLGCIYTKLEHSESLKDIRKKV